MPAQAAALAVRDITSGPIRPMSPVVLDGRSRQLPLFGVAIPTPGQWDLVYPAAGLNSLAAGIADRLAGSEPGATAYLGIGIGTSTGSLTAPGPAFAAAVEVGSPADYYGLQAGDQIVAIGGHRVTAPEDVVTILTGLRPDQTTTVTVMRDGIRGNLKITLGYRPIGSANW
jgi:membrane-associated protease RseP (regulator of RpoE activity)